MIKVEYLHQVLFTRNIRKSLYKVEVIVEESKS